MKISFVLVVTILATGLIVACGGGGEHPSAPAGLQFASSSIHAVVGKSIPADQPTWTGQASHFSVVPDLPPGLVLDQATGTLSGTPTAPAAPATYTIIAANSSGATSTTIDLLIAGILPDLRFQCTGAFSQFASGPAQLSLSTPATVASKCSVTYNGTIYWGPLLAWQGPEDDWASAGIQIPVPLVGDLSSTYTAGYLTNLDSELDDFAQRGLIVSSLSAGTRGYGIVGTGPKGDSSQYGMIVKRLADLHALATWAVDRGLQGVVVTAVTMLGPGQNGDSSQGAILAVAATRSGDASTFETQVVSGTPTELAASLPGLGQQGYVITAFGPGDRSTGRFLAVLTRKAGDSAPRSIRVDLAASGSKAALEGFVLIGRMDLGSAAGLGCVWQR